MSVDRTEGARLRVHTVGNEEADCGVRAAEMADFRLCLIVQREDLLLVTSTELHYEFSDGSSVEIHAGVPLHPTAPDRWTAAANGLELEIRTHPDAVGTFYEPGPVFLSRDAIGPLAASQPILPPEAIHYDGGRRVGEAKHHRRPATALVRVGQDGPSSLTTPCLQVHTTVEAHDHDGAAELIVGRDDVVTGGGNSAPSLPRVYDVRRGASIHWSDRGDAGAMRADHRFFSDPYARGGLTCFRPAFQAPMPVVGLCFDADAVNTVTLAGHELERVVRALDLDDPPLRRRVPRVRHTRARVTGADDADEISHAVWNHVDEITRCYNAALLRNTYASGRVTVDFEIDATGQTANVDVIVETRVDDPPLAACVSSAVDTWVFTRPAAGDVVGVRFPFILSAG